MLCLALKIGRGKTYVVRNITELAANIENNNVFSYGKALTFRHSLSVFDPMSRKLAEMVIREVRMHQEYSDEYSDGGLRRLPMLKNQIVLRGRLLDELFDLYNGNAGSPLNTGEYDPELLLGLRRMADNGILTYLKIPENIRFIDSGKHLYGLAASGLCRTSKEYRDNVLPLIRQMPRSIVMSKAQAAEFVSCVLPAVKDYVELDDPSGIAQKMMPDDCTPRFYFDWDEHGLSCRTAFIYGNKEIAPNAPVTKGAINRNRRVELSTDSFISSRMSWDESGRYYL